MLCGVKGADWLVREGPMSQIVVENLVKRFRVAERAPGIWGALRGVARRRYRTETE